MSILNDDRRFSDNEDEIAEWRSEMLNEFRRQEAYDRQCEERRECEYEEDNV